MIYIYSIFEYSSALEKALAELERKGFDKNQIYAIPLDKRVEKPKLFDSIHHSDGVSMVDLAFILGCIFMLLGSIYGFVLPLGPILCASIGLVAGFLAGLLIKYTYIKFKQKKDIQTANNPSQTEVILIVKCKEHQVESIQEILWGNFALGMAHVKALSPLLNSK